ncbi:MAG: integrase [Rhizobiales bacterium PAR1]|nr:MAG: integrase [Rhizobiales bacterium PAR1]
MGKLTAKQVQGLTDKGMYADGDGLYLQVTDRGSKSWLYRFKEIDSETGKFKQRYIGLGPIKDCTLATAREKANELRLKRRDGEAVQSMREANAQAAVERAEQERERKKVARTLRQAVEEYIAEHAKELKNAKHVASYTASMEKYVFPSIGEKPVRSITKHDIAEVIRPMVASVTETALKVQNRLHRVFVREMAHDYFEGTNPADKAVLTAMGTFAGRDAGGHFTALPYRDISRLWASLKDRRTIGALCLRFTILTCVRSREVRGALWSEVDLNEAVWTIPGERMKMDEPHRVPLSPAALEVLREAAKWKLAKNDLVFPGERKGSVITDVTMLQVVKRLDGCETTVHGLRST